MQFISKAAVGMHGWQRTIAKGSWLSRMLVRKPRMLVAITLANKINQQIWAMLTKTGAYKDPAQAGGA